MGGASERLGMNCPPFNRSEVPPGVDQEAKERSDLTRGKYKGIEEAQQIPCPLAAKYQYDFRRLVRLLHVFNVSGFGSFELHKADDGTHVSYHLQTSDEEEHTTYTAGQGNSQKARLYRQDHPRSCRHAHVVDGTVPGVHAQGLATDRRLHESGATPKG